LTHDYLKDIHIETTFKIFALLSPFIAASLTYFLGIKGKNKDIDIEKEKELNTILANLLTVWHYLTRLQALGEIMSNNKIESIFPKEFLPAIILNTGILNDECFRKLDESNEQLKKYDPITYYRLEGTGNSYDSLRKKYIMPFFNNLKLGQELKRSGTQGLLNETVKDIEEFLEVVSQQINKKTAKKIKEFIETNSSKETAITLEKLDQQYYEMMMNTIPDGELRPNFKEFKEACKTDESQKMLQRQMKILIDGKVNDALEILGENPEISMEELLNALDNRQRQ
jgi:hypothetical protein